MGMSASQARLLSITARLTDNEMSSQLITNSKLRLADKSSEASSEYMKALNATELMFYSYDDSGKRSTQALTAGALINYAELIKQTMKAVQQWLNLWKNQVSLKRITLIIQKL